MYSVICHSANKYSRPGTGLGALHTRAETRKLGLTRLKPAAWSLGEEPGTCFSQAPTPTLLPGPVAHPSTPAVVCGGQGRERKGCSCTVRITAHEAQRVRVQSSVAHTFPALPSPQQGFKAPAGTAHSAQRSARPRLESKLLALNSERCLLLL